MHHDILNLNHICLLQNSSNLYNQEQRPKNNNIQKPPHLDDLQFRQTHYVGAVDKLLTTQKISSNGFKGLKNHGAGSGTNLQANVSGHWPQPINFNKNTFQDLISQQPDSIKATRVPNIGNKLRNQKQIDLNGRKSPANMPKLQKITQNISSVGNKVENQMRSTHLRLDPIESGINICFTSGTLTTQAADTRNVN